MQMWLLPMNGEAQEVLSWRQGTIKTLRVLPAPERSCFSGSPAGLHVDNFEHCRPLIALADSAGPGAAFSSASFISLRSGEQVILVYLKFLIFLHFCFRKREHRFAIDMHSSWFLSSFYYSAI